MKATELIAFEEEIAESFNRGEIRHPIHLESGNEQHLIDIFQNIHADDWVCGGWRMHLKSLLKGVPRGTLKDAIMRGESISLCFPEYRVVSSAIVAGIIPIAMGIALGLKRSGDIGRVYCFLGDMTGCTGTFQENRCYARNHELPLTWVIEDNGKSVMTETAVAWGAAPSWSGDDVIVYKYQSRWPHAGAGKRVEF